MPALGVLFVAELFVHGEPTEADASALDPLLCIELEAVPTVSAYLMAKPRGTQSA